MVDERERERIESQERITGAQIGARITEELIEAEVKSAELTEKQKMEGARLGVEISKQLLENERKEE